MSTTQGAEPGPSNGDEDDAPTQLVGDIPPGLATPDERGHYLVVVDGLHPGRRMLIGPAPVTIGRVAPADIVIPDTELSRAHCRVEAQADEVLVTDLGSTNGTFVDGARVSGTAKIASGGTLRIGRQVLRHEMRSPREVAAAEHLESDLAAARTYVESLLPARLTEGPVRTDWLFEPSARIGGDVLGYHAIDENHFALYLMDVAGHGASAALHAASVMNVIRKQALRAVNMREPGQVLRALNNMFPMEEHGDLFFSVWYGCTSRTSGNCATAPPGIIPAFLQDPIAGGRHRSSPKTRWRERNAAAISARRARRSRRGARCTCSATGCSKSSTRTAGRAISTISSRSCSLRQPRVLRKCGVSSGRSGAWRSAACSTTT